MASPSNDDAAGLNAVSNSSSSSSADSTTIPTPSDSGGVNTLFTFGDDPQGYYHVSIAGDLLYPPISAYVPEQFTFSTQAVFESRFSAGLGGLTSFLQSVDNIAKNTTGVTLVTKPMTLQTWVSSSPVEFNLPLLFNAQYDGLQEVIKPCAQLAALCLPSALDQPLSSSAASQLGSTANAASGAGANLFNKSTGQSLLRGPGPTFSQPTRGTYTLAIGQVMVFLDMLIVSVNVEFDSLVDMNAGMFLSAKVDLTMRSSTIMLAEDIMQAFGLS